MKNCKLIVTDLDGTLLRNDKSISDFTLETLEECRRRGILIAFATARPVRGVVAIKEVFEPDILINHNGAVFRHKEEQVSLGIDQEQLVAMLEKIFTTFPDAEVGIESDDIFYANYDVTKNWPNEPYMMTEANFTEHEIKYADKILVSLSDEVKKLNLCLSDDCYLEIADGFMGMIMSKQATKWGAITSICDTLGINQSEVVCFGDDNNDISMLKGCAIGVAVANANQAVLEIAEEVTLSNEADGVAKWIREFIL